MIKSFVEKAMAFYRSIENDFRVPGLHSVSKEAMRSCCSTVETLKNYRTQLFIDLNALLSAVIRHSRSRLTKELERLKHYIVHYTVEVKEHSTIDGAKIVRANSPGRVGSGERSRSREVRDLEERSRSPLGDTERPKAASSYRLKKMLNGSRTNENQNKLSSRTKDNSLNLRRKRDLSGDSRGNKSNVTNRAMDEIPDGEPETTPKPTIKGIINDESTERLKLAFQSMRIEEVKIEPRYPGTRQVEKCFLEIDELIDKASKMSSPRPLISDFRSNVDEFEDIRPNTYRIQPERVFDQLPDLKSARAGHWAVEKKQISPLHSDRGTRSLSRPRRPERSPNMHEIESKVSTIEPANTKTFLLPRRLTSVGIAPFNGAHYRPEEDQELHRPPNNEGKPSASVRTRKILENSNALIAGFKGQNEQHSQQGATTPKKPTMWRIIQRESALNKQIVEFSNQVVAAQVRAERPKNEYRRTPFRRKSVDQNETVDYAGSRLFNPARAINRMKRS